MALPLRWLAQQGLIHGDLPALENMTEPEASEESLKDRVSQFERSVIAEALRKADGNQSEAARRLGLTRMTLIDKLKRHGLLPAPGSR